MKGIVILNALEINDYAFKSINDKGSSVERVIQKSFNLCNAKEVAILVDEKSNFDFPSNVKLIKVSDYSAKTIFTSMYEVAQNYNAVFFTNCDSPFLDTELANELFEVHKKYNAEYSFADGFPKGLTVEILDVGLVKILSSISNEISVKNNREFIFDTLKQNINSYDIETIIAPENLQHLRLEFFANNKRNLLLCSQFEDINAKNYAKIIFERQEKLFTLPAFYAIEVSGTRTINKIYFPKVKDNLPEKFLSLEKFKTIIDKIVDYSDDAVVSLSIFGEPFLNTNIIKMIEYCLQQKNISVLIETAGVDFDSEKILEIKNLTEKYSHTSKGKVFWIVCLDAVSKDMYAKVSNLTPESAEVFLERANKNALLLYKNFSSNVFPQFVRMNENEEELETFYRQWKEKTNNALIQKYDNLAGQIVDRRVADLSPIKRNVCWHLKRDMFILTDGTVLMCKEDAIRKNSFGNIFTDKIKTIREKIFEIYLQQLNKNYKGLCENCDEYYTYNF